MKALHWTVITLAVLIGGWLLQDGIRAFTIGDYVTPRSGAHVGQLGPWSLLVSKVGIDPRGTEMKTVHVVLGAVWLCGAILTFTNSRAGWLLLMTGSVCTLWYLPLGTIISILEIVLLSAPRFKRKALGTERFVRAPAGR